LSYAVGKTIAIVPNEKIYKFVFLVFIGFFSGRVAVSTHLISGATMSFHPHRSEFSVAPPAFVSRVKSMVKVLSLTPLTPLTPKNHSFNSFNS
jgi:hypothetical protein